MSNQDSINQYQITETGYYFNDEGNLFVILTIYDILADNTIEIELDLEEILPFDEMLIDQDHEFLFLN